MIKYTTLITVSLFVVSVGSSSSSSSLSSIKFGAFFNEASDQTEMAFKYTIQFYNLYSGERNVFRTTFRRFVESQMFQTGRMVCDMIFENGGVVAVFGPRSPKDAAMIQSVCTKLEIPYIHTSWKSSLGYLLPVTSLNFYPDADLLAKGFGTILRHLQWKNYAILYEEDDAVVRLQDIFRVPDVGDNPVTIRQFDSDPDQRTLLKELKDSSVTRIVLDCSTDRIVQILEQAKSLDMTTYFYGYFITNLDTFTLDLTSLQLKANVTYVRIFDPGSKNVTTATENWMYGEHHNGREITIDPKEIKTEAALMYDAVNLLIESIVHVNKTETVRSRSMHCNETSRTSDTGFKIVAYMKKHVMKHSVTHPVQFDRYGRRTNFTLYVIEHRTQKENENHVATWRPDFGNGLNFTRTDIEQKMQVLESLQKIEVLVSSKTGPPYLMERKTNETGVFLEGNNRYEGYSLDLIDAISKEMNFTYKFFKTEDNKNGNYDEEKKAWNGIIRDILEGKAHLGICDMTVTHQRRQAVDFSTQFMTLGISILHKKPSAEEPNIFAFLDPLSTDVWLYTATLYLAVSLLLYVTTRMAPDDWENPHPCDENPQELENIWTLRNCFWLTLGSIMAQGCDILPKGISPRMASSMWWFFSLLMTSSYTANLAAFLTKERLSPSIGSAEDLAAQTKIKYGVLDKGSTYTFFKSSNYTTYKKMWQQMNGFKPSVFEEDNESGVRRVLTAKNRQYAFLMESSSIEYEIERNCELRQVGNWLDEKGYAIAMPMNAPYRSSINEVILKFQEDGTLNRLKDKWWKTMGGGKCSDKSSDGNPSSELALANVGGVFLVLLVGVALAFVIAVGEFLWNVRRVAVQEHVTYWEAFAVEFKFALDISVTKKAVRPRVSDSSSKSTAQEETKSMAERAMHGAGSLLRLESVLERMSMQQGKG